VFRLCVRNLRLFGRAEVDLLRQGEPQVRPGFRQGWAQPGFRARGRCCWGLCRQVAGV